MPHICSVLVNHAKCAQKATANCVKYAERAKCAKMCPILAEAPTVDTTDLEEAFQFKAETSEGGGLNANQLKDIIIGRADKSGTNIGAVDQSGLGETLGEKRVNSLALQSPQHCLCFTSALKHSFSSDNIQTHIKFT